MRIKLQVQKKGLVIAAAEASFKEPDGRVKLTDFSVALFKDYPDGKLRDSIPEINTIQSDTAFLSFDEPFLFHENVGQTMSEHAYREMVGRECRF